LISREQAAQSMDLVDEMQGHVDAFLVHAQIVGKVAYQIGAGDVDFGQFDAAGGPRGRDPGLLDPHGQRFAADAGLAQEFFQIDVHAGGSSRG